MVETEARHVREVTPKKSKNRKGHFLSMTPERWCSPTSNLINLNIKIKTIILKFLKEA